MKLSDEELMAYADGEATPFEAKRIEAAMADDPALAARVARFRAVRRALRTAYDSVVSEPVPERLRALLGDVAASEPTEEPVTVTSLAVEREKRARPTFGPPAWAAIAASLVVGLVAGRAFIPANETLFTQDGLYAASSLSRVLDTRLAGDPANQSDSTRVGLTFRSQEGELCRTFAHNERERVVSGLACRASDRWAVRMALTEPDSNAGSYRQASAPAPAILEAVDAIIDGEPFDASQEEAALRAN
jgi:hypothetical protein